MPFDLLILLVATLSLLPVLLVATLLVSSLFCIPITRLSLFHAQRLGGHR